MKYDLKYEKTPVRTPVLRRKTMAKLTNDLTRLSTMSILWFLVKRHHVHLLTLAAGAEFALLITT